MRLMFAIVMVTAVFMPATFAKEPAHEQASTDDARFAFLKKLAGAWIVESGGPEAHDSDKDAPAGLGIQNDRGR